MELDWFSQEEVAAPTRVTYEKKLERSFKQKGADAGHLLINYAPTHSSVKTLVAQAYCARCHRWFAHGKKLEDLPQCGSQSERGGRRKRAE